MLACSPRGQLRWMMFAIIVRLIPWYRLHRKTALPMHKVEQRESISPHCASRARVYAYRRSPIICAEKMGQDQFAPQSYHEQQQQPWVIYGYSTRTDIYTREGLSPAASRRGKRTKGEMSDGVFGILFCFSGGGYSIGRKLPNVDFIPLGVGQPLNVYRIIK